MVKRSNPDQFQLRMPPGLRDQLREAADAKGRSMNAEIVARLVDSLLGTNEDALRKVAEAEGRARAFFDVFKLTTGILAEASGRDTETMALLAAAIRTLDTRRNSELDTARAEAVESLAKALLAEKK